MLGNLDILVVAPIFNIQLLLDGLLIGGIFALAAYGLALVWGVMNVKNLAQGDFVMMGGYITWVMSKNGIHPFFGLPVAFVLLWIFGWVLYKLVISRVIGRDLFTSLLATFGVAILFFLMLGDFTALGFFSQVANLGTRFVAADQARRAAFGDQLFVVWLVAFGIVAVTRVRLLGAIITSTKGSRHG